MQQPKRKRPIILQEITTGSSKCVISEYKVKNRKIQKGAERSDTPTDLAIQYHTEAPLAAAARAKPWMLRFHLDRNG